MRVPKLFLAALLLAAQAHADYSLVPIEVLFEEPETYSYSLSPDSRFLAGYLNLAGIRRLILVDTSTGKRYALIDFKKNRRTYIQDYQWIDNDTLFLRYSVSGTGNDIAFMDFRFVDGLPETTIKTVRARGVLVDPLQSVEDTVLFAWEPRPGRSGYRLYTITVDQLHESAFSKAAEFSNNLPNAISYRLDASSRYLLAATENRELIQHLYFDDSRKRWVNYFEHDPREYQFAPVGKLAGNKFAALTNKDTDRMSLVEFDLVNKDIGAVLYQHDRYDLTDAEVDADEGFVKSVSYVDHGRTVTEYFSEADSRIPQLLETAFPQKHVQLISGADRGGMKVLYVSASDDPGSYYLLDTATGQAELLSSKYPALEKYELSRSEVFNVSTSNGDRIEAILTRPKETNGVLLVNPHGGPIGIRDYASYNPEAQFFASRGYSVLNVNFRGSSGFGKAFLNTGRGQFGKGIEEDISTVVAEVTASGDFRKLCAMGASYGGYSAFMLAIRNPKLYQCVIATFGIFDLPLIFNASNYTLREQQQKSIAAVIGEYSDALKDVSPFHLARSVNAPVLLLAGTKDTIADYEQTNRMKYRLQQLSKPVEYYYYTNTGHGHLTWRGERHQFALIEDFIRRKLELELPAAGNTADVLGAEYMLIGEYYEGTTFVDDNTELAFRYYEKAADLNNAQAMYKLASFHEDGTSTDRNPDLAYDYLLQSSDGGCSDASYRLATLYRDGEAGGLSRDVDAPRSVKLFEVAREQGHALARFDLARALCTGTGIEPDLEQCLSLLTFDENDEIGVDARPKRQKRMLVLGELAWRHPPGSEDTTRISEFIGSTLGARYSDIHLEVLESGRATDKGRLHRGEIPPDKGVRFGAYFRVDKSRKDASDNGKFVIKGRLTGPATADEKDRIIEEFIHVGNSDVLNQLMYKIVDDRDRVEGDWRLEVRTLNNELLADLTFPVRG